MISRRDIQVVVIEDNPTDAEVIGLGHVRKADFQIKAAGTLAEGFERLRGTAFDVVLVDFNLPDCDRIEICARDRSAACGRREKDIGMPTVLSSEVCMQRSELKCTLFKPEDLAAATSRVFLGVRLECAQCHDHPFDTWKR